MSITGHSEDSLWQTCEENTMNESLIEPEKKHSFMQNISVTCSYTIFTLIITLTFAAIIGCIVYFIK
jgi:hypothetical protein